MVKQRATAGNHKYRVTLNLECQVFFFAALILVRRERGGNVEVRRGGRELRSVTRRIEPDGAVLLCRLNQTYLWETTTKPDEILNRRFPPEGENYRWWTIQFA